MICRLGFMPGSFVGRTRLGYASGSPAHGLGDTQGDAATAVELGIVDQSTMDLLLAEGATDDQIIALINGQIDLPTLQNALVQQPFAATQSGQPSQSGITVQPGGTGEPLQATTWIDFGIDAALSNLNSDISQLESWAQQSSAVQSALGAQITAARQQYNVWASKYQTWLNAAPQPGILTMPDGSTQIVEMQQAGVNPINPTAIAAIVSTAVVLGVAAAAVAYHDHTQALMANAKQIMANTGMTQQAIAQAAALSPTNPTLATQILQTAAAQNAASGGTQNKNPQPSSWQAWLQQNSGLVLGGIALVFVAPQLLRAMSGRR